MDNLESQTYEVFEKDPIKYSQYQEAIYHALIDRVPQEEKNTQTVYDIYRVASSIALEFV